MQNPILLGIGANLPSIAGSPTETVIESLAELRRTNLQIRATSQLFQTPAFPPSSGSDYVNAAVLCKSDLPPADVLAILHRVEEEFGRKRNRRWDARTLDIDLLAVGDMVLPDSAVHAAWRDLTVRQQQQRVPDQLILPHPRLQDRSFVLVPLAEIAPDWCHPIRAQTVAEMLAALPADTLADIRPL